MSIVTVSLATAVNWFQVRDWVTAPSTAKVHWPSGTLGQWTGRQHREIVQHMLSGRDPGGIDVSAPAAPKAA
jgi:hypothetical protein